MIDAKQINELLVDGYEYVDASCHLGIAPSTVKWHLHNVFNKTSTSSLYELLRTLLALPIGGIPRTP